MPLGIGLFLSRDIIYLVIRLVFQQVVEEIVQVVVQALHQVATHYHGVVICQIELAQILLVVILQHKTVWLQNA